MRSAPLLLLSAAVLSLGGCAGSDTQRYFPPKKATRVVAQDVDLRVLFVRQSVRELVVLVRLTNQGREPLVLAPRGPTPSWSVAIDGRTLPLAEGDRTYWSAWSGTITRDRSPLKVTQTLAPGGEIDVEVRWRLEPPVADAKAPWVLTAANLTRGTTVLEPISISFPGPETTWVAPVERNPNQIIRPGSRGYSGISFPPAEE